MNKRCDFPIGVRNNGELDCQIGTVHKESSISR